MVKNSVKYIIKIIAGAALLPIYFLIKLLPRDDNLWVFGSWDGRKIIDNSYHFYKYVSKNHHEIKCLWYVKNKNLIENCREKNIPCVYSYSIKGILMSLRASVWIYTHSCEGDISHFTWPGSIRVLLWHTIPVKKILFDDIAYSHSDKLLYFFGRIAAPLFFSLGSDTIIIVNSELEKKIFESALLTKDNIFIFGYPRNDILCTKQKEHSKKKVLYAPTFRSNKTWKSIVKNTEFWNELDNCAVENEFYLDIKIHDSDVSALDESKFDFKRTRFISKQDTNFDLNSELPSYDILISDYSGVIFDFMLLQRPIIIFVPDFEDYLNERGLYETSMRLFSQKTAKNAEELCILIKNSLQNPEKFSDISEKYCDEYHSFRDGKNSERIYKKIISSIS